MTPLNSWLSNWRELSKGVTFLKEVYTWSLRSYHDIGGVCDYKIVFAQKLYVIVMTNKANNKVSPADITDDILKQCYNIPKDRKGANEGEGNEH